MNYALEFLAMGEIVRFMKSENLSLISLQFVFSAYVEKVRRESIPTFLCKVSLQLGKGILQKFLSPFLGETILKSVSVSE